MTIWWRSPVALMLRPFSPTVGVRAHRIPGDLSYIVQSNTRVASASGNRTTGRVVESRIMGRMPRGGDTSVRVAVLSVAVALTFGVASMTGAPARAAATPVRCPAPGETLDAARSTAPPTHTPDELAA